MPTNDLNCRNNRRDFLRLSGLTLLGGVLTTSFPMLGAADASTSVTPTTPLAPKIRLGRDLVLNNIHTGEKLSCAWDQAHGFDRDALAAINRLMRDHRTGDVHAIDPGLLDLMQAVAGKLQVAPVFEVISGYRSPRTNQALRNNSRNVARKSYHLSGQAVDLRMPGVALVRLHQAALELRRGGVGLYTGPRFVHLDTGPVRSW